MTPAELALVAAPYRNARVSTFFFGKPIIGEVFGYATYVNNTYLIIRSVDNKRGVKFDAVDKLVSSLKEVILFNDKFDPNSEYFVEMIDDYIDNIKIIGYYIPHHSKQEIKELIKVLDL